jgi:phosphate transport system substrate-binding protein
LPIKSKALVAGVCALATVAAPAVADATTLTGAGSSAAQPYMLELFKAYSQSHHNVKFRYVADGGNAGVKDVQSGRAQFAINTRPPLPSDSGTTYVKLFLDGLCIGVNKANSLTNVTIPQLKNIFLGVDNNWGQVAGSGLSTTIDPLGRNSSAGQYTFFQSSVLGGSTQSSNVAQLTSDGLVQVGIGKDPNSIGYVGLSHSGSPVKALAVNGIACNAANIRKETYPLFRFDWGVIPSTNANANVIKFFRWVHSNKTAGQVINRAGAVAAFNKQ